VAPTPAPAEDSDDDDHESEAEVSIFERTSLALASNPLPPIPTLASTLSKFSNLHKLDLSYMQPGTPLDDEAGALEADNKRGLETLRFLEMAQLLAERDRKKQKGKGKVAEGKTLAESLTWLNLAGNPTLGQGSASSSKAAFQGLETVKSLFVLNLSSCSLRSLPPKSTLMNLSELRALILTQNRLDSKALEAIPYLPNLNTLVLSHNEIGSLPASLPANLPQLAKLSISHNSLGDAAEDDEDDEEGTGESLPDFTMCSALREVRLSHNARLAKLPSHIKHWGRGASGEGRGLDLLDVGHCNLTWDNVTATLLSGSSDAAESKRLRALKSLTLAGNADVEDEDDYRSKVKAALPGLTVLDNQRLVEKTRKGEKGGKAPPVAESGPAQWPKRGLPQADGKTAPSETQVGSADGGKKRKRDARGLSSNGRSTEDDRMLARAGPPPPDDDADAGVASDEETGKREIVDQLRQGKRKRAKRGKKKDMWNAAGVDMNDEEARPEGGQKKRAKDGAKVNGAGDKSKAKDLVKGKSSAKDGNAKVQAAKKSKDSKEGPLPATRDGKKVAKKEDGAEKTKKDKKDKQPRVAWDALTTGSTTAESPAQQEVALAKDQDKDKKSSRAQTSVAGIVEVKRTSGKHAKRESGAVDPGDAGETKTKTLPFGAPDSNDVLFGGDDSAWADGGGSAWD
jgi:Leucine-rich repeat (LRR) protein